MKELASVTTLAQVSSSEEREGGERPLAVSA